VTLALFCWAFVCGCISVVGVSVWMGVIVLSGYQVICSDSRSVGLFVCFDFTQRSHECILSPVSFRICLADRRQWWYIHRVIYFVYIVLNELERVLDLFEVCSERK